VCDKNALYSKLIVDEYFQRLVKSVGDTVEEVELLKDGTWRIIQEETLNLSDDDNDDVVVASAKNAKKPAAVAPKETAEKPASSKDSQMCEDIITLSDSDNDDDLPGYINGHNSNNYVSNPSSNSTRKSASPNNDSNGQRSKKIKANDDSDNSSDHSIICLGDDSNNSHAESRPTHSATSQRGGANTMGDVEKLTISASSGSSTPLISSAPPSVPPSLPSFACNIPQAAHAAASMADGCYPQQQSSAEVDINGQFLQRQRQQQQQQQQLSYSGGATPVLQTNGFHPPIFRPIIDDVAKTKVAQELANFLQQVCQKNSISNSA